MPKHLLSPLIAGLLSSGLFFLVFGTGLGFLFMFIPTLPVFYIALSAHPRQALHAALIAGAMIAAVAGLPAALAFFLFLNLPAWYMARLALRWHEDGHEQLWFPIGWIMVRLTAYACLALACITWFYSAQPGGLPHLLANNIHEAFAGLEDEYGDVIALLANQWAFLIFPVTIWMWGLGLYAHAWLANWQLARKDHAIRPGFSVMPFPMPNWVLSLLGLCALASLIGGASMRFLGNGMLVSLLLPYCFLGAALVNAASRAWPSRRTLLALIYGFAALLMWPAVLFSAIGLWHHVKTLNKHLSSGGSSFRS